MAERGMMRRLKLEVTCPLFLTNPRRLPCEHVYCKECLHGLALRSTTGRINCPECRKEVAAPNYNVINFSTPPAIVRMYAMLKYTMTTSIYASDQRILLIKVDLNEPFFIKSVGSSGTDPGHFESINGI